MKNRPIILVMPYCLFGSSESIFSQYVKDLDPCSLERMELLKNYLNSEGESLLTIRQYPHFPWSYQHRICAYTSSANQQLLDYLKSYLQSYYKPPSQEVYLVYPSLLLTSSRPFVSKENLVLELPDRPQFKTQNFKNKKTKSRIKISRRNKISQTTNGKQRRSEATTGSSILSKVDGLRTTM